jgi:hypothetical protein
MVVGLKPAADSFSPNIFNVALLMWGRTDVPEDLVQEK